MIPLPVRAERESFRVLRISWFNIASPRLCGSISAGKPVRRFGSHLDFIARLEFAFEQFHGERVEQVFLHRAFERARAELRVVAFAGQQFLRGGVHVEREILLREPLIQSPELDFHDARQFALRRGSGK